MLPTMSVKSKRDYLKKYLTDDKKSHKKKKNKKSENNERKRVKIIDDDVDIINNDENYIDDLILTGEDAPQIVGIIDERPPELRVAEDFQSNGKWKSVPRSNMNAGNNKSPNTFDNYFTENLNEIYKKDDNRNSSSQKNESLKGKHKENIGSNEDLSPRRKNESINQKSQTDTDSVEDLSSKQRSYKDSSDDISPKRKRNHEDSSPKRRNYRDSSNDITPKRKQTHKDLSSKRRNDRDSGDDMSPKRKRTHKDSSLKQQSPRRSRYVDSKQYSIEKDKIKNKNSNLEDLSPDRRRNKGNTHRNSSISLERNTLHERKTLNGKSAGLQDARSLKQESEKFRKQENDLFINMSNIISGKDAEVAVRNSSIKHRKDRKNLNKNPEEERKKMELEKEKQDVYSRWGKGLKQIEDYKNKIAEEQYEMNKPLARYSNDADLDEELKKQEREGDPMLEYIRKKDKNKKPNGKIIPIYRGSFPENRFNIRPGYRWDGVDRSNGYEKRWFEAQSKRKALQEELYKYSTEDM